MGETSAVNAETPISWKSNIKQLLMGLGHRTRPRFFIIIVPQRLEVHHEQH